MKILRITTEINRSSIGRSTEQIGRHILAEGWESYIAWGRADGNSQSKKIRIGGNMSVYTHVLLTRLFDMHGYGSYLATKQFIKKVREIQPDIVHLHDIHGYYVNLNVLFEYLRESKVPVVWTHHDCWAFTGHCGFYPEDCDKWKTECHDCPCFREYPNSWFIDGSKRNFRHKKELFTSVVRLYNVGVSQWICDELKQSFLNKYPIRRIYNGIDTEIFRPRLECSQEIREKYNLGNGTLLTAVATAWGERKGLSDYLLLREILPENYTLVFVGAPQELIEKLPKGIIGIRRTDSMEELVKIYSASSIVMNLASAESFGKTTPEGLACGVPSIVYNCTASPELVDNGTGIVVRKGDIEGVKNAVLQIMSWNKEETMMRCRERALSFFNTENNWAEYIKLYKEILGMKQTEGNPLF